jgi:hypothetical protein
MMMPTLAFFCAEVIQEVIKGTHLHYPNIIPWTLTAGIKQIYRGVFTVTKP